MTVEVHIDPVRCRGHAICSLLYSQAIELDAWGFGRVLDTTVEGRANLRKVQRAAAACPNGAIVVTGAEVRSKWSVSPGSLPA